jgi:hypothetical protein
VLGYLEKGADFGGQQIERFAVDFRVPTIMVGPNKPNAYHLNKKAAAIVDELRIKEGEWSPIEA